jgi:hypothetical protein
MSDAPVWFVEILLALGAIVFIIIVAAVVGAVGWCSVQLCSMAFQFSQLKFALNNGEVMVTKLPPSKPPNEDA